MSQKVLVQYASTREEHHKRVTFQDEYGAFFNRHRVSFDEWHVRDQLECQLFLRPYRASHRMGIYPG
jgi:hypothetical protein